MKERKEQITKNNGKLMMIFWKIMEYMVRSMMMYLKK
jgi:hypothetical protein